MTVSALDVQRAAAFAWLALAAGEAERIAAALAPAADLLRALDDVRPEAAGGAVGVGAGGMPLRADAGPAYDLARPLRDLAPASRKGYVLLPQLPAEPPNARRSPDGAPDGAPATESVTADALVADALAAELELGA
jgi:Asp-tRNA(Asn)/Glu-tRNA(Gln) amidotransferase C subunit